MRRRDEVHPNQRVSKLSQELDSVDCQHCVLDEFCFEGEPSSHLSARECSYIVRIVVAEDRVLPIFVINRPGIHLAKTSEAEAQVEQSITALPA